MKMSRYVVCYMIVDDIVDDIVVLHHDENFLKVFLDFHVY